MNVCQIEGCETKCRGRFCVMHYTRMRKTGTYELRAGYGQKRKHPLYPLWFDRKTNNLLAPEWMDFWKFVEDISPKPDGDYFLVRSVDAPYGPDNFKWQPHLKRQDGESNKDWWARKRQARLASVPAMERIRDLKRRFNLTPEDYQGMVTKHKGCCAICGKPETATEPKTGSKKCLAIDHCHTSGKIRGLLCWRCNVTLGKVEDSIPLLKKMIAYLRKHE